MLRVWSQLTQLDLQNAAHLVVPFTMRLHLVQLKFHGAEAPGRSCAKGSGTGPWCIARPCTPAGASTGRGSTGWGLLRATRFGRLRSSTVRLRLLLTRRPL